MKPLVAVNLAKLPLGLDPEEIKQQLRKDGYAVLFVLDDNEPAMSVQRPPVDRRERIAALLYAGLLACPKDYDYPGTRSSFAVQCADTLIRELDK